MKYILPSVTVIDPRSSHNGQTVDIAVEDGAIVAIDANLEAAGATPIEGARGRLISPGWIDGRARCGEPGNEERETYASLSQAASHGGFTHVVLMPSTFPVRDSRPHIEALESATEALATSFLPVGAISKDMAGVQLAEMADMYAAGALSFSDDQHSIDQAHLLQLALQYTSDLEVVIQSKAHEPGICPLGQAHEGAQALSQGLAPIPVLAETLRIQRDLAILNYAGGRLHIAGVSSAEGVEMIRKAKSQGLSVTSDVCIANLVGTDRDIQGFDTRYKTLPPLRSESDQDALWAGFMDGTIDTVVSDHQPMDEESKNCEWGLATFGAATIEHAFGWYRHKNSSHEGLERWIEAVCHTNREIYQLGACVVRVGMPADLTVFAIDGSAEGLKTRGVNVPQWTQNGRAIGTILGDRLSGF